MTFPHYAHFEGEVVPYAEAKIGVMTHALNYRTGAFGGVCGYGDADEEQLFVFRPIADGVMGTIATHLRELYDSVVRGKLPKYRHWNVPVYVAATVSFE